MFKKLLNKLFKFNQQMISKIEWEKSLQPILLDWCYRGVVGNKKDILFRKIGFISVLIIFGFIPLILLLVKSDTFLDFLGSVFAVLFVSGPILFMLYFGLIAGKFYTYRITQETIELASWKDEIPKFKEIINVMFWFIGIFLLIVFITDPSALLVGLGGMGIIGIIAGVTLYSKGFTERYLEYQHLLTTWDKVSKIEITEPLNTVYIWGDNLKDKEQTRDLFYLFYTPENKQQLFQLVKEKAQQYNLEIHYTNE